MRRRGAPWLLVIGAFLLFVVPSSVTYYTDWLWFHELGYEGIFRPHPQRAGHGLRRHVRGRLPVPVLQPAGRARHHHPPQRGGRHRPGRAANHRRNRAGRRPGAACRRVDRARSSAFAASRKLADVAQLLQRQLVRPDRSAVRPRHQLLRLPASCVAVDSAAGAARRVSRARRLRPVLRALGQLRHRAAARRRFCSAAFGWCTSARRHIGLLAGARVRSDRVGHVVRRCARTLLTPAESVILGAGYVDVHARLPILWITIVVLALGSRARAAVRFHRRGWPMPMAVGLLSSWSCVRRRHLQRVGAAPHRETGRAQSRAALHRATTLTPPGRPTAWTDVEEREVSRRRGAHGQGHHRNAATIENVRLWDHQPLLQTFAQIQEIRTYYDFRTSTTTAT